MAEKLLHVGIARDLKGEGYAITAEFKTGYIVLAQFKTVEEAKAALPQVKRAAIHTFGDIHA